MHTGSSVAETHVKLGDPRSSSPYANRYWIQSRVTRVTSLHSRQNLIAIPDRLRVRSQYSIQNSPVLIPLAQFAMLL